MATVRAVTPRGRHESRPGRGVIVAADLADLQGPVTGVVELPIELFWHPDRTFDLGRPGALHWMYENVLREAAQPEDLRFLNGGELVAAWRELFLPKGVRRAWEEVHPFLRSAAAAPAA